MIPAMKDTKERAEEHGRRLRKALALRPEVSRADLQVLTGRSYRTVTNWLNGHNTPQDEDRALLRGRLGDYERDADAVERALDASPLTEDRRYEVLAVYKRKLREQREERAG